MIPKNLLYDRDEHGNYILRKNYLIDGINCCPMSYDIECRTSNRQWKKNLNEKDIKQHHFILSFEPSNIERGLTLEKAQELGMEYARKHFSGHQCLVATHSDGHNSSKNIHCHIAFNSLRIEDLPELPVYTHRECDRLAGYKFHPTQECIRYLKAELMELCRANGLGQVELNQPAKRKVTNKEYWANKRGQERTADQPTNFQTELDKLRTAIDDVKVKATSVEDFKAILLKEYGISIRDKRGRWSYRTADKKNGVTARRLGADYSMEAVTAFITQQLERKTAENSPQTPLTSLNNVPLVLFVAHRLYNLDEPKYRDDIGLEQWAKLQNLKEMSRRFNFLCENQALSVEGLVSATQKYSGMLTDKQKENAKLNHQLNEINHLLQWYGQLNHTKKVYSEYRSITSKHQQRQFGNQNLSALELHSQACANLNEYKRSHGYADKPLPSSHQLMDKKTTILNHQNTLKTEIESLRESVNLLQNAQSDVMTACSDLGLTNHREYETIFGKKMSIRKQIQRKKYTEQHSQNGHNLHSLWKKYLELD